MKLIPNYLRMVSFPHIIIVSPERTVQNYWLNVTDTLTPDISTQNTTDVGHWVRSVIFFLNWMAYTIHRLLFHMYCAKAFIMA